jgi:hypothetical protein
MKLGDALLAGILKSPAQVAHLISDAIAAPQERRLRHKSRPESIRWPWRRNWRPTATKASFSATLLRLHLVLLLGCCLMFTTAATVAPVAETFGPGKVNCQILVGDQVDCLLSASRIMGNNRNEALFSLTTLPLGERALFRKWCLHRADECTVTIQGARESPLSTRLATVTSLQWTRPQPPRNPAAAAQ